MTQEVTPDPGLADQFEKVCHDLRQNIAMGLLLSDPAAGGEHVVPGERVLLRRAVGNLPRIGTSIRMSFPVALRGLS